MSSSSISYTASSEDGIGARRTRVASDAHTSLRGGLLKPAGVTKQQDVNHWGGNRNRLMSATLITCVALPSLLPPLPPPPSPLQHRSRGKTEGDGKRLFSNEQQWRRILNVLSNTDSIDFGVLLVPDTIPPRIPSPSVRPPASASLEITTKGPAAMTNHASDHFLGEQLSVVNGSECCNNVVALCESRFVMSIRFPQMVMIRILT